MTVSVEWHPSPYGTGHDVPRYRCSCGELHNGAQAAHQCRHPAMPKSHEPDLPQLALDLGEIK